MFFKTKSNIKDENIEDKELRYTFDKKFDSLNLGRRLTSQSPLWWERMPIRAIQKGKEIYHVCGAEFFSLEEKDNKAIYTDTHAFLIEKDGRFSKVLFTSQGTPFLNGWQKKDQVEVVLDDKRFALPNTTNIHNIYDLRYCLRNNKEAKKLMDDFIIVSHTERRYYKIYEAKKFYQEKKNKLLEKKILRWGNSRDNRR